jgi:mannose-6-phosphate isomerase-like protein (cupin superfamily)
MTGLTVPVIMQPGGWLMQRLTIENALSALDSQDKPYLELFAHGSLSVEIYKPDKVDPQSPHTRDEVYVIAQGKGFFVNDGRREPFTTGEVLFVAAGKSHRFEDFSDDFAAWVFFYGPEGGEVNP